MTDTERAKILLIDDDQNLTFILRAHLSAAGYTVDEAQDAEAGIQRAATFNPDLIVMDIGLPGVDGIEATRRIKSRPETADIPIIILTCRNDSDHVVMALEAGAQEYVVKPFDVGELLARIRTVNHLRTTRRELDELNNRLVQEIDKRTSRLRILYHFTRALNGVSSRNEILDLIIKAVQEVTGSRRVSILLKDPDRDRLVCARAAGIEPHIAKNIHVGTSEGIAGKVFSTGKTYVASTFSGPEDPERSYGSDSFVSTPLIATSLMTRDEKLGVLSITDKSGGGQFASDEVECIRSIADSGAIAINDQFHRERLNESVNVLLMTVGRLAEFRDNETSNHLERVCEYARILATALSGVPQYDRIVTADFVEDLYRAAPMHDIGKVGVRDDILCKPDKLTPDEYRVMKQHCHIGRDVLKSAMAKTGPVPLLRMCVDIASSHHERYDGHGYPDGLKGDQIPLSARIIALVDAYDAITSKRRYKDSRGHAEAVDIIRSERGKHFDPDLVGTFLQCEHEFNAIREAGADRTARSELISC